MPSSPSALAAALTAVLLTLAGCGTAPQTPPASSVDTTGTIPPSTVPSAASGEQTVTRLLATSTSGYRAAAELVVRDDAAWSAAWQTVHQGLPAEPPPVVDFATAMVIVVASGERGSGGHAVRVDGMTGAGSGAVVRYTVTSPGANCMTTQQITAPAEVVRVPRVEGDVRFERRTAVEDC